MQSDGNIPETEVLNWKQIGSNETTFLYSLEDGVEVI